MYGLQLWKSHGSLNNLSEHNFRLSDQNGDDDNGPQKKKMKMQEFEKENPHRCEEEVKKEIEGGESNDVDSNYKGEIEPRTSLMGVSVHQEARVLSLQVMSK